MRWLFRFILLSVLAFPALSTSMQADPVPTPPLTFANDLPVRLAIQHYTDDSLTVWFVINGEFVPVAPGYHWDTETFGFVWSPDCEQFAFRAAAQDAVQPAVLQVWTAEYGAHVNDTITLVSPDLNERVTQVMWSPSGTSVAYRVSVDDVRQVYSTQLETNDALLLGNDMNPIGWLSDTRFMMYTFQRLDDNTVDRDYYIATISDGGVRVEPVNGEYLNVFPDAARGDRFAAIISGDPDQPNQLNLYALDGTLIRPLVEVWDSVGVFWSPDGSMLTYQHGSERIPMIVDVETGETREVESDPFANYVAGWSNDSRTLFYRFTLFDDPVNQGLALVNLDTGDSKLLIESVPPNSGLYAWSACMPQQEDLF